MMNETDLPLLNWKPHYPHVAGHRRVDTSVEAAKKIDANKSRKMKCYQEVLAHLLRMGSYGATTHELERALAEYDYDYLQPRVTEMFKLGKIFVSEQRRKNAKGNNERVWIA